MKTLETTNLIMRPFEEGDAKNIFELDSIPLVHKYLGVPTIKKISEAEKVVDLILNQYSKEGIGRHVVIEKKSGDFMGWSGLKLEKSNPGGMGNYYDLGYRFIPKYWGKGYATESALASLKFGFKDLGLEEIYGLAHIDNEASNHILLKMGLKFQRAFFFEIIQNTLNTYRIQKDEWEKGDAKIKITTQIP